MGSTATQIQGPGPGVSSEVESLGVFKANRETAFHRWVHLTEGFSARLVARELEAEPGAGLVYDPFGGTGTTPLVAAEMGRAGIWAEVNPYLREAATIKVDAATAGREERRRVASDLAALAARGPRLSPGLDKGHPLAIANGVRDFFPPETLSELLGWVRRFESAAGLCRRAGLLAVASCAINASNMKRAVDLRRRTEVELERPRPSASGAVRERLALIVDDLLAGPVAPGSAKVVSADARELPEQVGGIDLVVTSPPYLNGTNYCRNTKLELLLLGLIEDESDLAGLRSNSVTAGINNVSRRMRTPREIAAVEEVAVRLDKCAYDTRIPRMIRAYFSDMRIVFATTLAAMRPGGRMVLDIGDSRFAGVHVDVPSLLLEIAEQVGWEIEGVELIRNRVAKDGNPLSQKLLRLTAGH